ncbi:MAG TPA: [protein-PII] uridylyltransferase [Terriglobales bacterium]|nr:[protein-PII] uridylyltransferase [Terriglobales bacterium]
MPVTVVSFTTQDLFRTECEKIRARFEESRDGHAAVHGRSDLIDKMTTQLWDSDLESMKGTEEVCVVALGGYGRQALFPYSDVDLLFLSASSSSEHAQKRIRSLCQALWDLHLRVSPSTRTLDDCSKLHRDNLEFNISLLDCRYLCGDRVLFERLREQIIPRMVARDANELMQRLADLTRERHKKYGQTIFHLEPNIKDCPGGIRDYQVAYWLTLVSELEKTGAWPTESVLPTTLRKDCSAALDFFSAVRCFLHYRQGRDLNGLTYELQSEAAAAGIGVAAGAPATPSEWMRGYLRHARAIYRLTVLLDEVPQARSGLYRFFESRKSRLSNADFSVVEGRVFLRQLSSVEDPSVLFSLFEFVARHGLKLSAETERCVEAAASSIQQRANQYSELWAQLRRILILPHAGAALRAMHRTGLLVLFFSEFGAIDSLVIRDYYHRYTVDEHSFVAIENLHTLHAPGDDLQRRFRDVLDGIEKPELLFLALLLHDVGKGVETPNHVDGSLQAAEKIFQRLRLEIDDQDTVRFLIASHLRMSATATGRDIFDPKVVQEFCDSVGTTERLKMLTLLTYADIKAVNPEALTPWKAEIIWQLYAASSNYLSRTIDDQRVVAQTSNEGHIKRVVSAAPPDVDSKKLISFLEGFPKRYLLTHAPDEIVSHYRMHQHWNGVEPQIDLLKQNGYYQVVLLTLDRPALFARVAGTLSSWGMNILKAEAFSNKAGTVLDTFRFVDLFRTLDMNPTEKARLKRSLADSVSGDIDVRELMETKFKPTAKTPKVKIQPSIHIDGKCSSHSTVVEITAQDRPGLLYDISSDLAELGCNIEVAIIDTQGQSAIDVFYVTHVGGKLDAALQDKMRDALLQRL